MKLAPLLQRFALFLAALSFVLCGDLFLGEENVARAAPIRIRVRGAAKLSARAVRDQTQGVNELVLSGNLTDDAGQPLALQSVTVRVTREADAHDPKVAEAMRGARGCDRAADGGGAGAPQPKRGPSSWGVRVTGPTDAPDVIVVTDEEGRFCFRARIDPDRYKATLVYAPQPGSPSALVDAVDREIAFDLSRRSLALRFDPTPHIVQLDTPRTTIEAIAILDDDSNPRVAPGLPIVLSNEKEELGRAITDGSGRARFVLAGSKLGPPGPGELHVAFNAPGGEIANASQNEEVERHVKVGVRVPAADKGELSPGVPEDGIPLTCEVSSSVGPLGEGSVEARVGEVVVGAAPVERGIARLTLTFAAQGNEALVRLRYVPASPWYEPLGEPTIHVPIRGPSLLSKAPILIAGLAVLAFFLVGRVSGQKNKPDPLPAKIEASEREGKPRLEVVRKADRGQDGWTGRVIDAHEGTPIAHARVWIERGTFEGRAVASAETDAQGRFVLPHVGGPSGDESINAEARLHSRFTQDLPPPGEVAIQLAERRRALLARLVKWAKRRGPPFDVRPEPTPGHVRRAASGDFSTARWADAIERAVFGPGDVDARTELEVERLAPEDRKVPAADEPIPRDEVKRPKAP